MKKEEQKKGIIKMGSGLPIFNPYAAGIDIGDTLHCVAINDGKGRHEVKNTSAFTCDLHEIVDYCKTNGVTPLSKTIEARLHLPNDEQIELLDLFRN